MRAVIDIHAASVRFDEPRAQLAEMVADGGFRQSPGPVARSPLFSAPAGELNRSDMIFTRARSANALSRSAHFKRGLVTHRPGGHGCAAHRG